MGGNPGEPSDPDRREHLDALLDEALAQTFPASDPVAIDVAGSPAARPGADKAFDATAPQCSPGRARPPETERGEPAA